MKTKLQVDVIPKIVLENPYRILGVYANSPKKEIVANKGRTTAFLRVGRAVEYPLDLKGILPPISRTLEMFDKAEAHLAIAKEQISYAQFWFLKITPLDDVAFNHLIAGNMAGAKEIWSKQESLSSLQNKLVCYLIENKPWLALKIAERLYGKFGDTYINKVDVNSTLKMTGTELLHQFIDTLGAEVGIQKILGYELGEETRTYISSQTVGPLISKITAEVEKAKRTDRKNPNARKEAGQKLIVATKEPLQQLRGILSVNDPQYSMIADKLGLEILQCGIDYYNNSEDDDAARMAMKLQKYAQSVVVGQMAKDRCQENVKILEKIIDELPPKEVISEDKAIKKELAKFVKLPDKITYSVALLNGTKAHLQSIKQKLGNTNDYYLRISTQIVGNALHNIIEEVNEAQQPLAEVSKILADMDPTLRSIMLSGSNEVASKFRDIQSNVKSTLREAWKATVLMDDFDMENSFVHHYKENRSTLKSLCDNMGVSTFVSKPASARPTPTRPISRPSTITSTNRSATQQRASTANSSSSSSSSSSSDNNGCIVAIIIMVVIGILGAVANGGEGFFIGLFWGAIIGGIVYKVMSD